MTSPIPVGRSEAAANVHVKLETTATRKRILDQIVRELRAVANELLVDFERALHPMPLTE